MDESEKGDVSLTQQSDPSEDDDTFERTREELRQTFEYQVQRLREIDSKAIEILKANLLLFGLVVTGGSILVQTDLNVEPFLNVFVFVGVFLLLVSTGLAGVTYTSSNLRGGFDADAVEQAIAIRHDDADTKAFEDRLLRSYGEWIEHNARVTAINDMFATVTVLLVIVAFTYFGSGIVVGIAAPTAIVTAASFVVQTVVLVWITRLVYHMDHLGPKSPSDELFEGVRLSKGASRKEGLVALREMLGRSDEKSQ